MSECPHDFTERETAVAADGYCPLCMAAEIERLRSALAIQYGMHGDLGQMALAKREEAAAFLDGQATAWDRQHTFPGSSNTKYAADCRAMATKLRGSGD